MRASILHGKKDIRMGEWEDPAPGPDEVRVKILSVGICGSDVTYYVVGGIGSQIIKEPMPMGHEPSGIIEDVGANVKNLTPGMRVYIEPAIECLKCDMCKRGYHNLCRNTIFLGTPPVAGVFRQYATYPARNIYPIPDDMTFDDAAMIEPLMVGMTSVEKLAQLQPGQTFGIFGTGSIGFSTLQVGLARGGIPVVATDILDYRLDLAKKMGVTHIFNSNEVSDMHKQVMEVTDGLGVDVAFECGGSADTMNQAIQCAAHAGKAVICGIPRVDPVPLDIHSARRKELTIFNTRRSRSKHADAIQLISEGKVDVTSWVTHHFDLEGATEGMALAAAFEDGIIKGIVEPNA